MTAVVRPTPAAQQVSFVRYWYPYAVQAGAALHVPASWILAQWAHETGYGTQAHQGQYNPGNIMQSGAPKNFTSPAAFVSEYIASAKADFPGLSHPTAPAVAFGGAQTYAQHAPAYGAHVASVVPTVQKILASFPAGSGTTLGPPGSPVNWNVLPSNWTQYLIPAHHTVVGSVTGKSAPPYKPAPSGPSWLTRVLYVAGGLAAGIMGLVLLVGSEKMRLLKGMLNR